MRFSVASVRRLTMQSTKVVCEEHSNTENWKGIRTELVVQGNVYWLTAKGKNGKVDGKLLRAMDDVEMRVLIAQSDLAHWRCQVPHHR